MPGLVLAVAGPRAHQVGLARRRGPTTWLPYDDCCVEYERKPLSIAISPDTGRAAPRRPSR